jgi:hypothetical protein
METTDPFVCANDSARPRRHADAVPDPVAAPAGRGGVA